MLTHEKPGALRLAEIVRHLGGEIVGDPEVVIRRIAPLDTAGEGDISFLSSGKYRDALRRTRATAVIVDRLQRGATSLPRILCDDPYAYFARLSALLNPQPEASAGVHPQAVIEAGAQIAGSASIAAGCHVGRGARIGERAVLGPGCVIGEGASIGDDSRLHSCVVVVQACVIGRRALIHSGAVIGSDGFGLAMHDGRWIRIPQVGRVLLGDDVEIGAGTTIDRGTLDDTVIEDGVKLDNQIQIGHNVHIGAHTAMAGCVGIAGSTRIGRYCTVGGGAVILGHLEIADSVNVSAGTLISKSITEAGTYTGVFPAQKNRDWARTAVLLRNIEKLERRIRELEKKMAGLRERG